jgi:hypothetical protein
MSINRLLTLDRESLARVVSLKLAGDETAYQFQEKCGSSDTTTFVKLMKTNDVHNKILVGVYTSVIGNEFEVALVEKKFNQNVSFLKYASGESCPNRR